MGDVEDLGDEGEVVDEARLLAVGAQVGALLVRLEEVLVDLHLLHRLAEGGEDVPQLLGRDGACGCGAYCVLLDLGQCYYCARHEAVGWSMIPADACAFESALGVDFGWAWPGGDLEQQAAFECAAPTSPSRFSLSNVLNAFCKSVLISRKIVRG
jgi:hypothetical protein